jgi:4-hydroxybenzoate polyprenyltransferase
VYRNSPFGPFVFFLLSVAFLLATFLSRQKEIMHTGSAPEALTTIQIGLMAFAMTFLVYAAIGFVSVWLDGQEHRPHKRVPRRGRLALAVGMTLCVLLVVLSGLFFHVILQGITATKLPPLIEGAVGAGMSVVAVVLLLVYQKYFMVHEVVAEDEHTEVPW